MGIKEINVTFPVSKEECERVVGREVTYEEFEGFARSVKKGIEASVDWDDIHEEAGNKLKEEEK